MLRNVRIVSKPERSRFENKEVWEKSSDIRVFNMYEQDWSTIVDEGLSHVFNNEQDEFERQKQQKRGLRIDTINK